MLRNDLYRPWFLGDSKDTWGFEIIDGEFRDVVIQVEKVEMQDDGSCSLDFHVVKKPETIEIDTGSDIFTNQIQLIINDILKEAIEIYEQTRDNDSQKPSSQ